MIQGPCHLSVIANPMKDILEGNNMKFVDPQGCINLLRGKLVTQLRSHIAGTRSIPVLVGFNFRHEQTEFNSAVLFKNLSSNDSNPAFNSSTLYAPRRV